MHVWTHLSPKYSEMQNSETGYGLYEAGMAQLDDIVGGFMKKLDDIGEADNTIFVFTTDNGAEVFTWPDGGMTPFRGTKGMATEGGFRVPCIVRWPGKIKPARVENGIFSGQDWYPTLVAAAGDADIKEKLKKGLKLSSSPGRLPDRGPPRSGQGDFHHPALPRQTPRGLFTPRSTPQSEVAAADTSATTDPPTPISATPAGCDDSAISPTT